ncbi:hypothetical protein BHAMNSH16_07770 [Brachyspira hampsonii]|uniref:Uncharacterized protein n=1 Tax=Brachyspira hampsonii TaxID=1287055 RepID=A0AAC9TUJ8_9SPIR|nr:hypothetical protein [Brachyspira hampsonii]ASJ21544.1 hypothetical protein BHAMNSH16_07770 [Brachyspira hampsonii]OEJ17955.1 hypothetical protein A9496_09120 [Brachyspira hampsonii]
MLTIITDDNLFVIEKPTHIYTDIVRVNLFGIRNEYILIIENDKGNKFLVLSSVCSDTIDRAYTELRDKIIDNNNNNIKTDLVIDFTNYK